MFLFSELGINLSWKLDNAVMVVPSAAGAIDMDYQYSEHVEATGANQCTDPMSCLLSHVCNSFLERDKPSILSYCLLSWFYADPLERGEAGGEEFCFASF